MSLAIKYENVDDARMRLRNTVVLYKGDPVLITDVQAGDGKDDIVRVLIKELPSNGMAGYDPFAEEAARPGELAAAAAKLANDAKQRKYISSKHFDIAPFKLGYVNDPSGAFYASRLPNRVQKQGLCAENFIGVDNFNRKISFASFLQCKEVVAMVHGDYPSIERAIALLGKCPSVAFDRDYAVVKDEIIPKLIYIYHKGVKVGMYNENKVTLGDKYVCLKERLTEMKMRIGAF